MNDCQKAFEVLEYVNKGNGCVNAICNRYPNYIEKLRALGPWSRRRFVKYVNVEFSVQGEDADIIPTQKSPMLPNECCGKTMIISKATRNPFDSSINLNVGKLWCSMCGVYK